VSANPFATLERQPFFQRTLWTRAGYLALAFVLDLLVLGFVACLHVDTVPHERSMELLGYHVYIAFDRWHSYAWMFVFIGIQIWIAHRAFRLILDGKGMISLYPDDKSERRKFGGLTGPQLVAMVQELAQQMQVGPIRRIIINDRPDPNAYTAHILGLGNIVVLHANLLDILPPSNVRAVVAHEVAHMRRKDSLMYLLVSIPKSFLYLLGAIILWKVGIGIVWFDSFTVLIQRLAFLYIIYHLAIWVLSRLELITNLASQQSEYIADAYAATACGVESMLNALLLLGERGEALSVLQQTLKQQPHLKDISFEEGQLVRILRRFPPREVDKNKAEKLAPRLYIEERLVDLVETLCVPLTEDQIVDLARKADRDLQARQAKEKNDEAKKAEEERQHKEHEMEKLLIDWRKYDRDRSGHLDLKETAALVDEMRHDSRKMIFRQFLEPDSVWQSHPTMRDRVLFLYDSVQQKP
jgi:Zn-dependent protease with chaperone function